MSAPVSERQSTVGRARTATIPAQRRTSSPRRQPAAVAIPAQRTAAQKAAQKAYARRDERVRRHVGERPARSAAPAGRAQFVLLVMVLLAGGLVATLWLSTAAAADSYRLQDARLAARTLAEQSARLHREVAAMSSAPALAERAVALGMVPVQDPARLVVGPDGAVALVGDPAAARAPAPPPPAEAADPAAEPAEAGATDPAADPAVAATTAAEGADPAAAGPAADDAPPDAAPDAAAAADPATADAGAAAAQDDG